jgi:hypothetical protein
MRSLLLRLALTAMTALALLVSGWGIWAGATWLRYGRPSELAGADSLLQRFVPSPEVIERHERMVGASPGRTFRAVEAFRLEDSGVVSAIFRLRELMFFRGGEPSTPPRPFLQVARSIGWARLDSLPMREVAYGAICQPWEAKVTFHGLPASEFSAFERAGYAKIAWCIAVDSLGPTRSRLRTETRVATTDDASRAKFRRYWSLFSPGISLIRHELLVVVARDARQPVVR